MRGLWEALAFLTVIPIPPSARGDRAPSPTAMLWWFAPVGLLIGVLAAGAACAGGLALHWTTGAAVGVVALAFLSGGLHLDGLIDTCDGLGSRAPRERALQIMRDPGAGSFGVLGVICLLLLQFALLAGMPLGWGCLALVCAPVAGRVAQVLTLHRYAYARDEGGMGGAFFDAAALLHSVVAVAVGLLATFALLIAAQAALGRDPLGPELDPAAAGSLGTCLLVGAAVAVAVAMGGGCARWINRRLGGHTGDTVGAVSEVTQLACLFTMALARVLLTVLFAVS